MSTALDIDERAVTATTGARIVVGVDDTTRGDDALVFARRLAGAALVLAAAYESSARLSGDWR